MSADIWSCGIVLYACLYGGLPDDPNEIAETLDHIRTNNFRVPYIDSSVEALMKKMLIENPRERITIKDIKRSEAFSAGVPKDYIFPYTEQLVIPSEPVVQDLDIEMMDWLTNLCKLPSEEIIQELRYDKVNKVKRFYAIIQKHYNEIYRNDKKFCSLTVKCENVYSLYSTIQKLLSEEVISYEYPRDNVFVTKINEAEILISVDSVQNGYAVVSISPILDPKLHPIVMYFVENSIDSTLPKN